MNLVKIVWLMMVSHEDDDDDDDGHGDLVLPKLPLIIHRSCLLFSVQDDLEINE